MSQRSPRVLTYNIKHQSRTLGDRAYSDAVLNTLKHKEPDMIALQQVRNPRKQSDLLRWSRLLDMAYVFGETRKCRGIRFGNAILANRSINATFSFKQPTALMAENRALSGVGVTAFGKTGSFWTTHFSLYESAQNRQVKSTVGHLKKDSSGTKILAGDLNIRRQGSTASRLVWSYFGTARPIRTFHAHRTVWTLARVLAWPQAELNYRCGHLVTGQRVSVDRPLVAAIDFDKLRGIGQDNPSGGQCDRYFQQ